MNSRSLMVTPPRINQLILNSSSLNSFTSPSSLTNNASISAGDLSIRLWRKNLSDPDQQIHWICDRSHRKDPQVATPTFPCDFLPAV